MKFGNRKFTSSRWAFFVFGVVTAVILMAAFGADHMPPVSSAGTYEIEPGEGGVYLLDTRTGQIWFRSVMFYYDLGTPQKPIYKSMQLDR